MEFLSKIGEDLFRTFIRDDNGNLIRPPVGFIATNPRGIYQLSEGKLTKIEASEASVEFDYNAMFNRFMEMMNWSTPTLNKYQVNTTMMAMAQSAISTKHNSMAEVNPKFELVGSPLVDSPLILYAILSMIVRDTIFYNRVEYNEAVDNLFPQILMNADRIYANPLVKQAYNFFDDEIFKIVDAFLTDFIDPFMKSEIVMLNNIPVNPEIEIVSELISTIKKMILVTCGISGSTEDTIKPVSDFVLKLINTDEYYERLVKALHKTRVLGQKPRRGFGTSELDNVIYKWTDSASEYYLSRIDKFNKKSNMAIPDDKLKSLEVDLESEIYQAVKQFGKSDPNIRIQDYYTDVNKSVVIRLTYIDVRQDDSRMKMTRLINNLTSIAQRVPMFVISNSKVIQQVNYSELYLSLVSKLKIEIAKSRNQTVYSIRYVKPYISLSDRDLIWSKGV